DRDPVLAGQVAGRRAVVDDAIAVVVAAVADLGGVTRPRRRDHAGRRAIRHRRVALERTRAAAVAGQAVVAGLALVRLALVDVAVAVVVLAVTQRLRGDVARRV